MSELRLVIFDVDGTLVDSQALIAASMGAAFAAVGVPAPSRADVLGIVGLSLEGAMARLAPELNHALMVEAYRAHYFNSRSKDGTPATSPFFDGARDALEALHAQPYTLLAIATGKSKRGVDALIEGHGLQGMFISLQCSDFHPSKPHPSMVRAALADAGVGPARAVMVGDTSFDIEMARAAGVKSVGVGWGYHAPETLGADALVTNFAEMPAVIDRLVEA